MQRPSPLEWDVAVGTGLLRVGAGVALLLWRRELIRSGGARDDVVTRGLFTYFGVRDIALGLSALAATRPGGDVPRQVTMQGVADTTDALLITAVARTGRWPGVRGIGAIGLAAVTALAEFAGAVALRRRTP